MGKDKTTWYEKNGGCMIVVVMSALGGEALRLLFESSAKGDGGRGGWGGGWGSNTIRHL